MSNENVEIVRRAFDAWNRGDPEDAIELLDPDIDWRLPPNFPDAEAWHGREAVVQGLSNVTRSWDEFRVDVQELIDAGDRVVALVRFHGRGAITGLDLDGVSVDGQVWTIRGGKAIDVQMYNGSGAALEAVGLGGASSG
jgi:ketosteroid isomerase-like protein